MVLGNRCVVLSALGSKMWSRDEGWVGCWAMEKQRGALLSCGTLSCAHSHRASLIHKVTFSALLDSASCSFQEIHLVKAGGPLGLSIVGGSDHSSHPFGIHEPGVFISKVILALNIPELFSLLGLRWRVLMQESEKCNMG